MPALNISLYFSPLFVITATKKDAPKIYPMPIMILVSNRIKGLSIRTKIANIT